VTLREEIRISKKDFDFLITMAIQGADEQCGEAWDETNDKIDEIIKVYKKFE